MAARSLLIGACVAAVALTSAQPAAAQNFFQRIFGGFWHHREAAPDEIGRGDNPLAAFARAFAPPSRREEGGGGSSGFCVRTCDGFHFPVRANPGASAAQMCTAFCPSSETRLYSGSNIDTARANDGSRYADLDSADQYRKQIVSGCSCNGRTAFGLAHIDVNSDPTLRPGDVVATRDGLMAYTGDRTAAFTPAADYGRFSKAYREQLSAMHIAPPALEPPDAVTSSIPPTTTGQGESRSAEK